MYKQRLKEYIEEEQIYQDYKKGKEPAHNDGCSDFEWFCIEHFKDIEDLLNEVEDIEEKYNKRSKKWEKWETEKSILSTRMSEYLCKYQNIKREYTNQIANATKKKKEIEELHNKIDELEKYSRGNIEACENRLNSPFCNFERVTKELMIHKNYLEILAKDSDVDEPKE